MTDVLAIVQARSSSSRFPGKVLQDLHGAPMILRQLERVARCTRLDAVVVATSVEGSDDELAATLVAQGVQVRRGPLADVFGRFGGVIDEFEPSSVVRLTADCPLTDPAVIDDVVGLHTVSGSDYTSNVIERTFPHGLDAECFTVDAFRRLQAGPLDGPEREHVTLGFYRRPNDFSLASLTQAPDHSDERWTVDYPADLDFVRSVYAALYDSDPNFSQSDVLRLVSQRPDLRRTTLDDPGL